MSSNLNYYFSFTDSLTLPNAKKVLILQTEAVKISNSENYNCSQHEDLLKTGIKVILPVYY